MPHEFSKKIGLADLYFVGADSILLDAYVSFEFFAVNNYENLESVKMVGQHSVSQNVFESVSHNFFEKMG